MRPQHQMVFTYVTNGGMKMLAILRERNFALLWFAGLISIAGDWMLLIAMPLHVYQQTGSTLATGGMFMAAILPSVLLGSLAGVFVDRWDRKRVMVWANLSRALILLPLLLVNVGDWLWIIYIIAAVESTIGLFFGPAENALLPTLVGEDRLVTANSLNALNNNLARLIGPPIGGAGMAFAGLGAVAVVDAATYLVGGVLIALITRTSPPVPAAADAEIASAWTRVWGEWREGLRLVGREKTITVLLAMSAAFALGEGILGALYVPFVTEVLRGSELYLGWLMSSQAVGGLLGAVLMARFGARVTPRTLLGMCAVIFGLTDLAIWNARSLEALGLPRLPLALVLILLVGIPATGLSAGFSTLLQSGTRDEYRGRVFGTLATTQSIMLIVGIALAGVLGETVGIVPMLSLDSGLYVLAGVVGLLFLPRLIGAQSDAAPEQPALAVAPE
ncbi:MAG: MFS transporter [Chloroflexota bacterium]|nr:MFS transporter [Chloroflexota bacterium]